MIVKAPYRWLALSFVLVLSLVNARTVEADEVTSQTFSPEQKNKLPEAGQNPISGLDSLTIGFNFDGGVGSFDRTAAGVHFQPTVPIGLTRRLALIAILDLSVKGIPDLDNGTGTSWGFGDTQPQFLFAMNVGQLFIGPGVDLLFPTATTVTTGQGKWQFGPALIFIWAHQGIVAGFTFSQRFSVGGDDARPSISKFSLQPTVFINLPKGTFLMYSPLLTQDWKQTDALTVPVGAGLGKLVQLGNQNLNINTQAYWNAVAPSIGPKWTVIFQLQLLFPEKGAVVPH